MAAPKPALGKITLRRTPVLKRTSQGIDHRPKNKHARKNFKRYVGQGRP